jgi:signal peptidase II
MAFTHLSFGARSYQKRCLAVKWSRFRSMTPTGVEVFLKRYFRDYLFLFSIAGFVIIFDQWTKNIVRSNLKIEETWVPWDWLAPYARIVHWQNTGAAFGLGQDLSIVFALLALVVVGAIIYYFPQVDPSSWLIRLALGMQIGGALGNLIDRLTQEMHVTDFVSVGRFAVWNIADASISVGTVILILGVWIDERKQRQAEIQAEEAAPEADPAFNPEEIQGE